MDQLSSPDDGADIGAGLVLLLSGAIFVSATLALVVALVRRKLPRKQAVRVSAIAVGCAVLMSMMWSAG